jgi:hypothetical protein
MGYLGRLSGICFLVPYSFRFWGSDLGKNTHILHFFYKLPFDHLLAWSSLTKIKPRPCKFLPLWAAWKNLAFCFIVETGASFCWVAADSCQSAWSIRMRLGEHLVQTTLSPRRVYLHFPFGCWRKLMVSSTEANEDGAGVCMFRNSVTPSQPAWLRMSSQVCLLWPYNGKQGIRA